MDILALVSRWAHIIPALILVGGTIFMRFSLVPAANESSASDELRESIRRRWSKLVAASVLFLLVSGLYNTVLKAKGFELSMVYNVLLLVKIILALGVFYLSAVLSGRSKTAQKFRERETHYLNILCGMMLAIVIIAGFMKMCSTDFPVKVKDKIEQASYQSLDSKSPVSSEPGA